MTSAAGGVAEGDRGFGVPGSGGSGRSRSVATHARDPRSAARRSGPALVIGSVDDARRVAIDAEACEGDRGGGQSAGEACERESRRRDG